MAISTSSSTERIIPISILGEGEEEESKEHRKKEDDIAKVSGGGRRGMCEENGKVCTERQSLLVTLEDGSTTRTDGEITRLGHEDDDESSQVMAGAANGGSEERGRKGGGAGGIGKEEKEAFHIQEIGQETLKRVIRQRNGSPKKKGKQESDVPKENRDKVGGDDGTPKRPNADTTERVRIVPIKLPDGSMLQRSPDDTMKIRAEFTNYCHQQFEDPPPAFSPPPPLKSNKTQTSVNSRTPAGKERIVPIRLEASGQDFVPTFSHLNGIELPEWSAFSPKEKSEGKTEQTKNSGLNENKKRATTNGQRQSVEQQVTRYATTKSSTTSTPEPSPSRTTKTTMKKTQRQSREQLTKSHEKKVQHTVRFVDDDNDEKADRRAVRKLLDLGKRSSSLDSRKEQQTQSPVQQQVIKPARERHHSSPGIATATGPASKSVSPERTLNEIDQDITKIWRELQELDSLPTSSRHKQTLIGLPRRGSPARRIQHQQQKLHATPVKIRTFTTPAPTSIVSRASYNASTPASQTAPARRSIFDHPMRETSSPKPPLPSGTASPTTTTSKPLSTSQTESYHIPRRPLEPTRPGSITPAYSSSLPNSFAPRLQRPASPSRQSPRQAPRTPPPPPPATILRQQQHQQQQSKRKNSVEFYPRFETRPRASSAERSNGAATSIPASATRPTVAPCAETTLTATASPALTSEATAPLASGDQEEEEERHVFADKACQTEAAAEKSAKKGGKCSLQ